MTPAAILFFLLVVPFFLVLAAWVRHEWPEHDPTDDTLFERRSVDHFRQVGR